MGVNTSVPYIVHEGMLARQERTIKRLWVLCIVIFLCFVGSNAAWIWYESQWEVVETSTTTDQTVFQEAGERGFNQFVGGDLHGETDSPNENDN